MGKNSKRTSALRQGIVQGLKNYQASQMKKQWDDLSRARTSDAMGLQRAGERDTSPYSEPTASDVPVMDTAPEVPSNDVAPADVIKADQGLQMASGGMREFGDEGEHLGIMGASMMGSGKFHKGEVKKGYRKIGKC